jgi:hypothetical protein
MIESAAYDLKKIPNRLSPIPAISEAAMLQRVSTWWNQLRVQQKVWVILLGLFIPLVCALAVHVSLIQQLPANRCMSFAGLASTWKTRSAAIC